LSHSRTRTLARMAANFVQQYGRPRLRRLIRLLQRNESGQLIARELEVSRERVRQWKNAFGKSVYRFEAHAEVRRLAGLKPRP